MADNGTILTNKQATAAAYVAADELSNEEIAEAVGIGTRTLYRWKEQDVFKAAVNEHVEAIQSAMLRHDIAKRHKRLGTLNRLHEKMLAVIDDRAKKYADAPGGETGLIVEDVKAVGNGRDAQIVEVYAFDAALVREIRAVHEQAAKELGQWTEKSEIVGTSTVNLVGIAAEDV